MVDFKKLLAELNSRKRVFKCNKCGREIECPNMFSDKVRSEVLTPYCCTATVFTVQWLIHHGWHVRDLGVGDTHPFFCPDCWEEGTPEYSAFEYGKQWCEQAEAWLKEGGSDGTES